MSKNILIDTTNNIETRIAVTDDGKLDDFVWKTISLKVDKYKPFLLNNIDTQKYKEILRRVAL